VCRIWRVDRWLWPGRRMRPLPVGKGKSEDAATDGETPPGWCRTYDSGQLVGNRLGRREVTRGGRCAFALGVGILCSKHLDHRRTAAALTAGLDLLPALRAPPGRAHPEESVLSAGHRAEHVRILADRAAESNASTPASGEATRLGTRLLADPPRLADRRPVLVFARIVRGGAAIGALTPNPTAAAQGDEALAASPGKGFVGWAVIGHEVRP
jgi:hypothetical protein